MDGCVYICWIMRPPKGSIRLGNNNNTPTNDTPSLDYEAPKGSIRLDNNNNTPTNDTPSLDYEANKGFHQVGKQPQHTL